MPDMLKKANGDTSWSAIFMGFAVALVLILQQWQTMHIAEIKTQGEVDAVNFMSKDNIIKIQAKQAERIRHVENNTMPRDTVDGIILSIDHRISAVEKAIFNLNKRELGLEKRKEILEGTK